MKRKAVLSWVMMMLTVVGWAQQPDSLKWWNPEENPYPVIEGRGWQDQEMKGFYHRLPARAEKTVRAPVWRLSQNATGLIIRFKTDAKKITVKYSVKERLNMPHFSSTGVSGVDLYSINAEGGWNWTPGKPVFGDTIIYQYNLSGNDGDERRTFLLYLPIYNTLSWLKIGVPENATFTPLAVRKEKPIIVYGTSITQGGCASRPGMAWPSIVGRKLNLPFINLGFSGNGTLDKEMIDLVNEVDARVFILDCIGNLMDKKRYPLQEVKPRLIESVKIIRAKHPHTPILLPAFAAFHKDRLDKDRGIAINEINGTLQQSFTALKKLGITDLYMLTAEEMNMGMEDMVDYGHPTDLGLFHYAQAFEKELNTILNQNN